MSDDSPAVILFDSSSNPLAVSNGVAIPANTSALLFAGSDGTNSRYFLLDNSGKQIIVGAGVAGTPSGGVVTIQGVLNGTTVPISAANIAINNTTAPGSSVQIGGTDGANIQAAKIFNLNTGVGTDYNLGVSIRLPSGAGSIAGGTSTNPLRIDPTGTTPQPISGTISVIQPIAANLNATVVGTVTANVGTTNGLALDTTVSGLQVSQGSATSGQKGGLTLGAVTTSAPSYTTAQTSPISLTTTGLLRIDGSGVIQPVSGTVTANQGGAPWSQNVTQFGGVNVSTGTGASGTGIPRVTVSNDSNVLVTQSGTWTVQPGNTANTTPWLVTDSSDGPVTPGAAAGKSSLMGGQFNTALPTLTNTQQSAIQLDSSGRVLIGAIPTGANTIGSVNQGTSPWVNNISQFGGTNISTGTGAGGAGIPRVTVSNDSNVLVTPPTLIKGTQGSTGFSVQDLKDAGRVVKVFTASAVTGVTTETMVTLTPLSDFTAGSTGTSFAVTAGKRLRIQSFIFTIRSTTNAVVGGLARLRVSDTGTVTTSTSVIAAEGNYTSNVSGQASSQNVVFPDGLELSGTMQLGVSQLCSGTTAQIDVSVIGYEY
jgi:hypothetical protein